VWHKQWPRDPIDVSATSPFHRSTRHVPPPCHHHHNSPHLALVSVSTLVPPQLHRALHSPFPFRRTKSQIVARYRTACLPLRVCLQWRCTTPIILSVLHLRTNCIATVTTTTVATTMTIMERGMDRAKLIRKTYASYTRFLNIFS